MQKFLRHFRIQVFDIGGVLIWDCFFEKKIVSVLEKMKCLQRSLKSLSELFVPHFSGIYKGLQITKKLTCIKHWTYSRQVVY